MRTILGIATASLLLATSGGIARETSGTGELVATSHAGFLAVDSDCKFYRRHLSPVRYEFAAQGPVGIPKSLVEDGIGTDRYKLGMANGDVYQVVYTDGVG